jgi:hypothetical protein
MLQWEASRERTDDLRCTFALVHAWLNNIDASRNFDEFRSATINWILKLQNL